MESNRELFQEMREQEAFENPHDYERHEEKKRDLSDWCNENQESEKLPYHLDLHARAKDHLAGRKRQELAKYGDRDEEFINKFYNRKPISIDKPLILHNHAQPMTDLEKSRFVYESSDSEKADRLSNMQESFKKLRNERA